MRGMAGKIGFEPIPSGTKIQRPTVRPFPTGEADVSQNSKDYACYVVLRYEPQRRIELRPTDYKTVALPLC